MDYIGTGRRKTSVARVRLRNGNGIFKINGRDLDTYFKLDKHKKEINHPFILTNTVGRYDVIVRLNGGGVSGQKGALIHGIARALCESDKDLRGTLKKAGLLTRDARMVERKKYGLAGARKRFQFSKR